MTGAPSPNAIVSRLVELSLLLDKATADIDQLDETAVKAKGYHRRVYANAFLTATGAMDMRTQQAILQSSEAWFEFELADQQVRACKERLRTLRDQIEIARSLSAAIRSEWAATGLT